MIGDFQESPVPGTFPTMWERIVRLVRSLNESEVVLARYKLERVGANYVTHGRRGRGAPRFVDVHVVADEVSAVQVNPGMVTDKYVVIHASAPCTVSIKVSF